MTTRLYLLPVIFLAILGCKSDDGHPPPAPPSATTVQPSAEETRGMVVIYQIGDIAPSLANIAAKLDRGFTKDDAERLATAAALVKRKEMSFKEEFGVAFQGKPSKLGIEVEFVNEKERLVRFVSDDDGLKAMI